MLVGSLRTSEAQWWDQNLLELSSTRPPYLLPWVLLSGFEAGWFSLFSLCKLGWNSTCQFKTQSRVRGLWDQVAKGGGVGRAISQLVISCLLLRFPHLENGGINRTLVAFLSEN